MDELRKITKSSVMIAELNPNNREYQPLHGVIRFIAKEEAVFKCPWACRTRHSEVNRYPWWQVQNSCSTHKVCSLFL